MPAQLELPVRDASGSSVRLAILLSAAVCPGAGHFAQRRRILGVLYFVVFVAALVIALLSVFLPLMANLRIGLDLAEKGSSEPFRLIPLAKVLAWFGLAVLIYLLALVDIIAYARRQARQGLAARLKHLEPL